MIRMKVFYSTSFKGHNPVGTAAIIIAPSKDWALATLRTKLDLLEIKQDRELTLDDIVEVDTHNGSVNVLQDGNY